VNLVGATVSPAMTCRRSAGTARTGSAVKPAASEARSGPISVAGSTWSAPAILSALVGIPSYSASSGSWTTAIPPARRMACKPDVPSLSVPDSTTPTDCAP
jgi:hypothetical protein